MKNRTLPVKIAFMLVRAIGATHLENMVEFSLKSSQEKGNAILKGKLTDPKGVDYWGTLVDEYKDTRKLWKDKVDMELYISKGFTEFKIEIKAY